jgi:hypothetical protein
MKISDVHCLMFIGNELNWKLKKKLNLENDIASCIILLLHKEI